MKFHAAILAPNGQVSSPERRDSDLVAGDPFSRKMMAEFQNLLREHLTDDPTRTGKFRAKFGDIHHVLEWQQVEPLSARGTFFVRGQVAAASFYLHGFAPDLDDAVLEATEALFANLFAPQRSAPSTLASASLCSIPVILFHRLSSVSVLLTSPLFVSSSVNNV